MPNAHRGEIEARLDGRPYTLCLTLGALAELEHAFGHEDMLALAERFQRGRLSARDAQRIIAAGLRGAGHDIADVAVAGMQADGGATGYVEPTGPAAGTVDVEALASIKFDSDSYTAPEGIVQFNYTGATGHTLLIQDPQFDGFVLTTDAGGPNKGKVELPAGKYTIYCDVPGHEAQGMHAELTVS